MTFGIEWCLGEPVKWVNGVHVTSINYDLMGDQTMVVGEVR